MAALEIMKCPQCQAEATPIGSFWVCGVHGTVPEPKPFSPLRSVIQGGPKFDVKTPLQDLNPFALDTQSESNRADIRN